MARYLWWALAVAIFVVTVVVSSIGLLSLVALASWALTGKYPALGLDITSALALSLLLVLPLRTALLAAEAKAKTGKEQP